MTSTAQESSPPADPGKSSFAAGWLHPRRIRFWALLLILLYTLGGFFAAPSLIERLITGAARDYLDRTATVDRVRLNPYTLSLEISGFELADRDNVPLLAFERLFVNFQLSSLFRWAWTFREIRLDAPAVRLERFAVGDSRLTRLLADLEARTAADSPPEETADAGGWPRLLVQDLGLNRGQILFRDDVPARPVEVTLGPTSVSVQDLNTLPDRYGRQTVEVRLPGDARLSWEGNISLAPLQSEGSLVLERSPLEQTIAYLEAILPLDAMQVSLSVRTDYRIEELQDGSLDIELDGIEADLTDLAVSGLTPSTEFLAFSALEVRGGTLRMPEQEVTLASVEVIDPELTAWLSAGGELSLAALAGAATPEATDEAAPDADPGNDASEWQLRLDAFRIRGGRAAFADNRFDPAAAVQLQNLELSVTGISSQPETVFPVALSGGLSAGGTFRFEGQVMALPELTASGTAKLTDLPLPLAQPYLGQYVNIVLEAGALSSAAELTLQPEGALTAAGDLTIGGLKVRDPRGDDTLLSWQNLDIDRFEADAAARTVGLSRVTFGEPFTRIVINEDRTTNLDGLIVPAPASEDAAPDSASPDAAEEQSAWGVVIGSIAVDDGSLDFSDFSLPLPFATKVLGLGGTVTTIDTGSAEAARMNFEGQVDDYGLARIDGFMSPVDPTQQTDVTMQFRNLLMANFSPYSAEFAGREIEAGKLDLDLRYRLEAGALHGENAIVMSDLVLGDEVDNPDAASLPLELAVALLTDANGVIDINLPVEGDVNDPEFKIGGVIWQAFTGLITKVVSAPFRLLGNLIGIESEDLGQFEFLAGRYDLTPPEREKILQIGQALQQRPELNISVTGAFDPAIDTPALQYQRLKAAVVERIGQDNAPGEEAFRMLSEEIRAALEAIHLERFPAVPLEELKAAHRAPPEGDPEGQPVLDELAYAADLRDRLLAAEEITTQDLEALADTRAEAIRTAFLEGAALDAGRIQIEAPVATESEDGEWVVMELGVVTE